MTEKPKQKRANFTRERIIRAAMEQLESEGYANLTVAKVVERAQHSIGAYMHHFSSKEKLLVALIDTYHQQRTEALEDRFGSLRIRNRGDVVYFLQTMMEIQLGYVINISNEFFMAQRTDTALRWHGQQVRHNNRERSHQLYRQVFGPEIFDNSEIFEIIDDYTNIFLRSLGILTISRSEGEVSEKKKRWTQQFADMIEAEIARKTNETSARANA